MITTQFEDKSALHHAVLGAAIRGIEDMESNVTEDRYKLTVDFKNGAGEIGFVVLAKDYDEDILIQLGGAASITLHKYSPGTQAMHWLQEYLRIRQALDKRVRREVDRAAEGWIEGVKV